MIKIAVLGCGTVGTGVYEVLAKNQTTISAKVGEPIEIKYILDIRDFPGEPFADKIIHDFSIIEKDPEVRIVCEVIGGATIAYDFSRRALKAGKHVVTSNKELVATHGAELLALARENQVNYLFEASVGGGIPIIRPMMQCLSANQVTEICGILNGTTNYILTRMIRAGLSFDAALKEAQEKGYAEANPAADIEGHDACRKLCILASLALGKHVYPDAISTEGITKITLEDVAYGESMDRVIKLLGRVSIKDGKVYAFVAPHMIDRSNPLSGVEDVFNAIMVKGNAVGQVMFYGAGAGKLPTASAVVADVIDCARHLDRNRFAGWEDSNETLISPVDQFVSAYYVRLKSDDECRAMATLNAAQKVVRPQAPSGEFAVITAPMTATQLAEKCKLLSVDGEILTTIRIL